MPEVVEDGGEVGGVDELPSALASPRISGAMRMELASTAHVAEGGFVEECVVEDRDAVVGGRPLAVITEWAWLWRLAREVAWVTASSTMSLLLVMSREPVQLPGVPSKVIGGGRRGRRRRVGWSWSLPPAWRATKQAFAPRGATLAAMRVPLEMLVPAGDWVLLPERVRLAGGDVGHEATVLVPAPMTSWMMPPKGGGGGEVAGEGEGGIGPVVLLLPTMAKTPAALSW